VAISDLDGSCAEDADLCEAAAALFSAGADLDLVVIGGAPIPACLGEVGSDAELPLPAAAAPPAGSTEFRVTAEGSPEGEPALAVGTVGEGAVEVPPGRIRVSIDLDPAAAVGPVELLPGQSLQIRILEVPASEPRRWEVFIDGAGSGDGGESGP
jgi:hypothetical protein